MPAETSVGMSQETRDRLDDYRTDGHHSIPEVIEGLMSIVPPAEDVLDEDACSNPACEEPLWVPDRPEDRGGVIVWWSAPEEYARGSTYFCSVECAFEEHQRIQEKAATYPDKVVVGGGSEMVVEVEVPGIRLFHEGGREYLKEIGVPVPLDLVGEDRQGNSYDYHGEPIEVWSGGRERFSSTVGDIRREETHTAIYFD